MRVFLFILLVIGYGKRWFHKKKRKKRMNFAELLNTHKIGGSHTNLNLLLNRKTFIFLRTFVENHLIHTLFSWLAFFTNSVQHPLWIAFCNMLNYKWTNFTFFPTIDTCDGDFHYFLGFPKSYLCESVDFSYDFCQPMLHTFPFTKLKLFYSCFDCPALWLFT